MPRWNKSPVLLDGLSLALALEQASVPLADSDAAGSTSILFVRPFTASCTAAPRLGEVFAEGVALNTFRTMEMPVEWSRGRCKTHMQHAVVNSICRLFVQALQDDGLGRSSCSSESSLPSAV